MKVLHIDCSMGIAGDMLLSALSELMPDQEAFINKLNNLGIPGVEYKLEKKSESELAGAHIEVSINGEVEESCDCHDDDCCCGHDHHHEHHHHHHHEHNRLSDIEAVIEELNISISTQEKAVEVYEILAEAESLAHNQPVDMVHFHEVGAMDAVADIVGVCQAISLLRPDKIVFSPINTGFGKVKCAHGILDVPAPATANILDGMPIYKNDVEGELCTPTGAALARYFADEYDEKPIDVDGKIGYGFGMKQFKYPNVVTATMYTIED